MKLSSALTLAGLCALFASSGHAAEPKLGDFVVERVTTSGRTFDIKLCLSGYDGSRDEYWISRYSQKPDGTWSLSHQAQRPGKSTRANYAIDSVETFCADRKGALEMVKVPAGTFKTCKISVSNSSFKKIAWYASGIPFGIIKSITEVHADPSTHELVSFGQNATGRCD